MEDTLTQLIAAQQVDKRLVVLRRRLESLPVEVSERESNLSALQAEVEEMDAERLACLTRSNKLEIEVGQRDVRIAKLEKQALESVDPSAAQVARHEAEGHREANSTDQEEALDLLERAEELEGALVQKRERLTAVEGDLEAFRTQVAADQAELEGEAEGLAVERGKGTEPVPSNILAAFEQLSTKHPGKAVVPLKGDSCGGCGSRLVPNDRVRVQAMKSLMRCPSCTRILVTQDLWSSTAGSA